MVRTTKQTKQFCMKLHTLNWDKRKRIERKECLNASTVRPHKLLQEHDILNNEIILTHISVDMIYIYFNNNNNNCWMLYQKRNYTNYKIYNYNLTKIFVIPNRLFTSFLITIIIIIIIYFTVIIRFSIKTWHISHHTYRCKICFNRCIISKWTEFKY